MSEHSIAVRATLAKEGIELPNREAAKRHAIEAAFAILAADFERGELKLDRRIDLEDATGRILYTICLRDLVEGDELPN